jgi:hypothetical protein
MESAGNSRLSWNGSDRDFINPNDKPGNKNCPKSIHNFLACGNGKKQTHKNI